MKYFLHFASEKIFLRVIFGPKEDDAQYLLTIFELA